MIQTEYSDTCETLPQQTKSITSGTPAAVTRAMMAAATLFDEFPVPALPAVGYGSAGRRTRTNHQSDSCCQCGAEIGPGRSGRRCKKCRGAGK